MTGGTSLEQTVLGHALNNPDHLQHLALNIGWDDFSADNHKVIAFCMLRAVETGVRTVDEDTVQLFVGGYPGESKEYGGSEYIRLLKQGYQTPTENYETFVASFKLQATKATIGRVDIEAILRSINNPLSRVIDVQEAIDKASTRLESVRATGFDFYRMDELHQQYLDELEDRKTRDFFTTGIPSLDELMTEGFLPKKVTVMAGFTGMAKSTTAIAMAHRIAVKGIGVGFFSMEAPRESVLDKMVSAITQIPTTRLKKEADQLDEVEYGRIDSALASLSKLPMMVNDRASLSMDDMRYLIRAAQSKGNDIKVVFVDLFGKLEDVDTGKDLASTIQKKIKEMRVLAQELKVHFVLLVQVGRDGYGGGANGGKIKRPTIINLKNSNAYAEEPDNVLLLHRNKYYQPELDDDILEIGVAKQRDGEANTVCYLEMFADRGTILATAKRPHDMAQ